MNPGYPKKFLDGRGTLQHLFDAVLKETDHAFGFSQTGHVFQAHLPGQELPESLSEGLILAPRFSHEKSFFIRAEPPSIAHPHPSHGERSILRNKINRQARQTAARGFVAISLWSFQAFMV